jgi:hypothetical protein
MSTSYWEYVMTTRRLLWQRNVNKEELLSPRNVKNLLRVRNDQKEVPVTT